MRITQLKDKTLRVFRYWFGEVILLIVLLVLVRHQIGQQTTSIAADGIGYYDYLPSLTIRGDLDRNVATFKKDSALYSGVKHTGGYVEYKGYLVNKYPCGVALLQSPFFFITKANTQNVVTGYEPEFQRSAYYAALFYLFLGLFFLKQLLLRYSINRWIIFVVQAGVGLGTNLTFYTVFDSVFSHVYSFFAITVFLYVSKRYFEDGKMKWLLWSAICLGLILLLRQMNIVVLFTLPFLAGNWTVFKERLLDLFKNPKSLFGVAAIVLAFCSIQFFLWYQQTGSWFIYSYQGEYFDLTDSNIINVLFSYQRGWFVYTPLMFIAIISSFDFMLKRQWYLFLSFGLFFLFFTYLISCWWIWTYGSGFGHRVFVDYYSFFVIPLALCLNSIRLWIGLSAFILITTCCIFLNIIQIYQYKHYILDWMSMNKEKYWLVFLEKEVRFEGLVWKEKPYFKELDCRKHLNIKPTTFSMHKDDYILLGTYDNNIGFHLADVRCVSAQFRNDFNSQDSSAFIITIYDSITKEIQYYDQRFVIHFQEEGLNKQQTGIFWFKIPEIKPSPFNKIEFHYYSRQNSTINDLKLRFYTERKKKKKRTKAHFAS